MLAVGCAGFGEVRRAAVDFLPYGEPHGYRTLRSQVWEAIGSRINAVTSAVSAARGWLFGKMLDRKADRIPHWMNDRTATDPGIALLSGVHGASAPLAVRPEPRCRRHPRPEALRVPAQHRGAEFRAWTVNQNSGRLGRADHRGRRI
jgi:hypothetical protein